MGHQVPTNARLWQMIIMQAKAKFAKYPSPGASHWVHSEYVKHGGQFAEVNENTRQKKMAKKHFEEKKREQLAARSEKTKEHEKGEKKNGGK